MSSLQATESLKTKILISIKSFLLAIGKPTTEFFERICSLIIDQFTQINDYFIRSTAQKERIGNIIREGLDIDLLYWLQLLSSVVIATFGLLTNSIPVIIGAMLIAPLLQPIQGVSYAVATGNMKLYLTSFKYIAISICVALAGASILSLAVPFRELTPEILARTTPTILDLGIAFASGIIAFLVLGFKKLSGTIVGAAIAASLLPPLCATGIGLVFLNREVMRGTFLLFTANLVAIIIAGVLFFYMYGFRASTKTGEKRKFTQLLITLGTLLIISIPLYTSMSQITHNWQTQKIIKMSLETILPTINPQITLLSLTKKERTDRYDISLQLKVPESIKITTQDKNTISQHLASQLQFPVEVSIEVTSVTSVYIPKKHKPSLSEQLHTAIVGFLGEKYPGIVILDFVYKPSTDKQFVIIEIYAKTPVDTNVLRKDITTFLTNSFDASPDFYVYIKGQVQEKTYTNTGNELQQELLTQLGVLFPDARIDTFQVSLLGGTNSHTNSGTIFGKSLNISTSFATNRDPIRTRKTLSKRKRLLTAKLQQTIKLQADISYFEKREE